MPSAPSHPLKELTDPGAGLPNKLIAFNVRFSKWWQSSDDFSTFTDRGPMSPDVNFPSWKAGARSRAVTSLEASPRRC